MQPTAPRPSVVFVHGLRTSCRIWDAQVAHVRASGSLAVALDLPAHGARRDAPFSMSEAFAGIDRAIAALPVDRPVLLVGLSLGGYTSLAYAARNDRVAGVVAAACTWSPRGKPLGLYRGAAHGSVSAWTGALTGLQGAARGVRAAGTLLAGLLPRPLPDAGTGTLAPVAPSAVAPPSDVAGPAGPTAYRPGWDVVTAALGELVGRSSLRDAGDVVGPVWFVNGARDPMRLEERRHLSRAREGRLVVVPGAGHDVNTDAPEAFAAVLDEALLRVAEHPGATLEA
ncbi:alpha/beta fold hydrolase [Cellulomonas sp. PhB143]|uniref:alpha/beta fold hydrolase n=1 Tax=Cellulomonas sp. PhB143 TaxID=2485186 RepID=UPI000F4931BB|nr:alpha/beta hydrolase [Cellulomonas sp. PhB143]ROS76851.1 pimeloyl-ACP methyl ester carboxylesterase [Cellulomonas sp. PhB143]